MCMLCMFYLKFPNMELTCDLAETGNTTQPTAKNSPTNPKPKIRIPRRPTNPS